MSHDARESLTARLLASAPTKLAHNVPEIRKRALRQLSVALATGACDRAALARDPATLSAMLNLCADDAWDESDGRAVAREASEAAAASGWSPAATLTWLVERERVAGVWLEELGARKLAGEIIRRSERAGAARAMERLTRAMDAAAAESRASAEAGAEAVESTFAVRAPGEMNDARRSVGGNGASTREESHGEATTSAAAPPRHRASFATAARNLTSASGDGGFELSRVDVGEHDAQYLYALAKHLDTCAHHALALGGLRELRRALMDLPAEAVVRLAPRALERACELLAAMNPKLSTTETRREALHVIQQCASALHRELQDASRECLIASGSLGRGDKRAARSSSLNSTVDYAPSFGEAYFSTGSATRILPVAHVFMLHVIPSMCEPSLRADAIRAVRLLLPLVQIAPNSEEDQPHGGALLRLGQYLDLWETTLATLEFESGAASEYLTCVQLSAELAAWAGGAPARGVGAPHRSLAKRWYDICLDEVISAANPLLRQYCARALIHIRPTLPIELSLVKEADECLRVAATAAAEGIDAVAFASVVSRAAPALSLLGSTLDVRPFAARMMATLLALVCAADNPRDENTRDAVATATLAMLSHCIEGVRAATYATLAAAKKSARVILHHPTIIDEIIIGGLNHLTTASDASKCLEALCEPEADDRREIAVQLSAYAAWLDALEGDQVVGKSASLARRIIEEESVTGRLGPLSICMRGLFHQDERTRIRSATDLAHGISHGLSSAAQVLLRSYDDPFDSVLLRDEEYVREESPTDSHSRAAFKESLRLRTFDDVRAALRRFIFDDVKSREELTAELEIMTSDERLASVLADPTLLDALIKLTIESSAQVSVITGGIRILSAASGASILVRDMLSREDGRGGRIAQLLGLVFHPQRRIREAMALLLARFLFLPVTESVAARAGESKPRELSLPKVFLETYRFPLFVPELENPAMIGEADPFASAEVDRNRVLYMFRRRQLLLHTYDVAYNEEAALLAFALNGETETESAEIRVMRDAARISCTSVVLGKLVGELGDAQTHEAAARVVDALKTNVQASRVHAMSVLASLGRWSETSERFLRRPPRSTPDVWLWVGMAELLTASLESFMRIEDSVLPPAALETLISIIGEVVVPLASSGASLTPDANTDVMRDPPVLRHPIAAGQALGSDAGARSAARAAAVHAGMNLLALTYEAARRFKIYAKPDYDADGLVNDLVNMDCVSVISVELLSKKSCDYAVRCAAIDAATAALRLGGVSTKSASELVRTMLEHVYPSYTSSEHRGSVLMNRVTRSLLLIMESTSSSRAWSDAFYDRTDFGWLNDMLSDPSSRGRARAYDILAASVGPSSPIADIVASDFPDLFELSAACALDAEEAVITRAAAFRCVASLLSGSSAAEISVEIPDDGYYAGERSSVPFPSIPMLAAKDVWRDCARVLMNDIRGDTERVGLLHRGASAALLAAARVDALGIAEAFDYSPSHESDGTMWHALFAVLRRAVFVGDGSPDSAAAASNVAAILGVMTVAGCRNFDAKIATSALHECLTNAVRALRRGGGDNCARAASRCAEALATMLQTHSRGSNDLVPVHGIAAHCAEILASAVDVGASPERVRASIGACLLTSTVFRSTETSARAIAGAFQHVGASMLQSLLVLWHYRLLGNSTQRAMVPTMSVIISATRNLLAYDLSAKAAACEWGLVGSLIQTTLEAVRRSMNPDGSFKSVPTALDVYVASEAMKAKRKDALAAALEFGMDVDGKELPSTVALGSLTCLRHMMYACPSERGAKADAWLEEIVNEIRERAADGDIVGMFHAAWPYARLDQTVMYELLSLVVNFLANSPHSKRAITESSAEGEEKPKSFAQRLLKYAFDSKHEPGSSTLELALKALSSLCTVEGHARYWLLRSIFVNETAMTLAHALTKARASDGETHATTRERWMSTVVACVRALSAVASFADGQRAVLRASAGAHVLELCLEVVAAARDDGVLARREAFLLMHNLAYHADSKAHFAANEVAIDCLVHGASDGDARCASAACAALFALARSQRVVALLRERGRDRALRAASKSRIDAENADDRVLQHRSRCLRGVLRVLRADENDRAYANV